MPSRTSLLPVRRPADLRDRSTIHLHHDVLDIVVYFVFLRNLKDLLQLCRATKQLHFACIPWIYHTITIDFSNRLGLALLPRLSRVSSKIPAYVRSVVLKECGSADRNDWILLEKCLSQFQRLLTLSWDNYANLPKIILEATCYYHAKTKLLVTVNRIHPASTDRLLRERNFFTSPALGQLTCFELCAKSNEVFYDSFKRDLLHLLTNAPNLILLRIYRGPIDNDGRKIFPEMMPEISTYHFPQLRALHLQTRSTFFTRRELEAWGSRNGWSKLLHLTLSRATDLIPFISRIPQLTHLDLMAEAGHDMAELGTHLQSCTGKPLGAVKRLIYRHSIVALNAYTTYNVMPWSILQKISATLTEYVSWHPPLKVFYPGFATPTARDLRRFLKECPQVTHLMLDIEVISRHWPRDILAQLAAFHNVKELSLYVHQPPGRHVWPQHLLGKLAPKLDFTEAFGLIIDAQAKALSDQQLRVKFKEVRDYKDMEAHWDVPDWIFWTEDTGKVGSSNRHTEKKTKAELLRRKEHAKNERRSKDAKLEKLYGDGSITLFDRWSSG